jgi:hypothetical protein
VELSATHLHSILSDMRVRERKYRWIYKNWNNEEPGMVA